MAGLSWSSLLAVVVVIVAEVVRGYDVRYDDYQNALLPGGAWDSRGFPNSPFTTDSNRLTDGVSSFSPYSVTSPSFPLYTGTEDALAWRREHAKRTQDSAKQQGVAGKQDGDFDREASRFRAVTEIHWDEESETLGRPENSSFPVFAGVQWNPSNFAVQYKETYRVDVPLNEGGKEQLWTDGHLTTNAAGYDSFFDVLSNCWVGMGKCRSSLKIKSRLESANRFELVCGIGPYVWKLVQHGFDRTRFLPLREDHFAGTLERIGTGTTFTARDTGELVCFANDAEGEYWNNVGGVNVTVTRVSWPPPEDYTYFGTAAESSSAEAHH